jgi:hypothetical protein
MYRIARLAAGRGLRKHTSPPATDARTIAKLTHYAVRASLPITAQASFDLDPGIGRGRILKSAAIGTR